MRSSFSGTKWTVHINNRGFHDREIFLLLFEKPALEGVLPKGLGGVCGLTSA